MSNSFSSSLRQDYRHFSSSRKRRMNIHVKRENKNHFSMYEYLLNFCVFNFLI